MNNENIDTSKKSNKKLFIIIGIIVFVIVTIVITVIVIKFSSKENTNSTSFENYFDNTLNVNNLTFDYKDDVYISEDNDGASACVLGKCYDTIFVDFTMNTVFDEDAFLLYDDNLKIEDTDFFTDGIFKYSYKSIDGEPNYITDITDLLNNLKTLEYQKENNIYVYNGDVTKYINELVDNACIYSDYSYCKFKKMELVIDDNYVKDIKIYYTEFDNETNEEWLNYYIYYSFYDLNKTDIGLTDEIRESALESYIHFKDIDNYRMEYKLENDNCENNISHIRFDISFETADVYYCAGDDYDLYLNLYIKNISKNYDLSADHSNDVYEIFEDNTNKSIGKFTYNKDNDSITIYDSELLNGTYNRDK